MKESAKIIENGYVFTGDKQNRSGCLTLLIQKGRIIDIGKPAQVLKSMHPSAEVINASGKVILPGFVDAHHTGESFILRYLTSGQPMSQWNKSPDIQRAYDYLHNEASYEDFISLYRLSYFTALKSGVTTLVEYGIDNPENSFSAALEAMRQANLRGIIGLHNGDQIEAAKKLNEQSVRFAVIVADEEILTTYNLQSKIRIAQELHWQIILHLGQTKRACELVKKNFKKSVVQLYSDYRLFDHLVHFTHLVCFDDKDYGIISKAGLSFVLSPSAILLKGADMPPFAEILKRKISLAFGTDWGAARPLENIQAYISILKTLGLPVDSAYDLLSLHTKNGARVLGIENEIGTIEIGKKADFVFLDLSDFRMNAILADDNHERILEIVLNETASQKVRDVMINGEFYVREGHLLTYSEDDLANEGKTLLKKLIQLSERHPLAVKSSAKIFSFPNRNRIDNENNWIDLPEEGSKIISEKAGPDSIRKANDSLNDNAHNMPGKIKKIFGDDEE